MPTGNWRRDHRVLVTDAQAMGSVAAIRSLGRAGYRVYASSHAPGALGLRSKFACRSLRYPSFDGDAADFRAWLLTTVEEESISAIVPSEGVLLTMREDYSRLRPLLPLSGNAGVVYAGMSKCDLFARFEGTALARRLPSHLLLEEGDPPPTSEELEALGAPVFIKTDAIYATLGGDSLVERCLTGAEAESVLRRLRARYRRVLVQGYAHGVGVGVFLLRWNNRVLGHFMHRRLHEVPHTGGASSYREAWWNDAIFQDAIERIEALQWEGVAMFEYRWDPATGEFFLLEFNGRFWGSLHLALYAGVDFPRLLLDAFFGHEESCETFNLRTRSRWTFPREVEYLWSRLKDGRISLASRMGSIAEFFLLGLDPRIHSDLSFPGDRMLYLHGMRQALRRWTTH